jgi:RHS repeat-associated protein
VNVTPSAVHLRLRRRWRRSTRLIAAGLAAVLAVGLTQVPASAATPPAFTPWKPEPVPTVPVTPAPAAKPAAAPKPRMAADKPAPVWPSPGVVTVDMPPARRSAAAQAGSLPVRVGPTGRAGADAPGRVRVEILDQATSARAGVRGLLLRAGRADGATATGEVSLTVDYSRFATGYGADWSSRLRLVAMPECALTTPAQRPCAGQPLPSRNDPTTDTVSATVPLSGQSTLLAVTAGPSSAAGDYKATTLQPSSTWSAGGNSGAFTWSYPMRVPPAVGGPAPEIALSYSSQSVDGRHAASNNQPSWVGEGFEAWPGGFIERRYKGCATDMDGSANNNTKTGDLCWETSNATLSLNGSSGELIYNSTEGRWHLRSDDGSRIERKTGAANADNDGEYWVVTTVDGTQYWFGINRLPGWASDDPLTNSAWTVPVFGNDPGEPCHATAFADSDCIQAWRWNLDYVVDRSGNSVSYWYSKETNRYGRNRDADDDAAYDRGGWLDHISYGTRRDAGVESVLDTPAPTRVNFGVADRCLSSCGTHDETHWPDTPWDQACAAAPCTDTFSPTFWTTKRLSTVTTQIRDGSGYDNVERWTLTQSFPDPGDGTRAGLWLDKISHVGLVGAITNLPDVEFTGVQLSNRVDTIDFALAMNWWRIEKIRTESGGTIGVVYSDEDCVAGQTPTPSTNTRRCYPVIWTPEGYANPVTDWFHKYVVTTIYENDNTSGTPPAANKTIVHTYQYLGGAAWHYADDDGLIDPKEKTWSDYRGYGRVAVTVGDPGEQTYTEARYFRGMHGDKAAPSGGTRTVAIDGINDEDWYAGTTRETKTFNGPGGTVVSRQTNDPWPSPATATRTLNGDTVTARFSRVATTRNYDTLDAGRGERATRTTTSFDSYGMATQVDDYGEDGDPGDEQCTKTDYTPRNDTDWVMDKPHRVQTYAVKCADTAGALTDADIIGETRSWYDDGTAFETAPTRGLVTKTEQMAAWNSGAPTFTTVSKASYDTDGRATATWDANNAKTTIAYTPATGGPVTATTFTNPMLHVTTTTLEPAWGSVTSAVDPNDKRTDLAYDGLGRLTAVWLPGRDKATQTANVTFAYLVRTDASTVVTTSKLNSHGQYITSYALFDGLLRPRQTQAASPSSSGGRLITDTFYDSAGRQTRTYDTYHATGAPGTTLVISEGAFVPSQTRTVYDGAGRTIASIFQPYAAERWRTATYYAGDRTDVTPPAGGTATSTVTDARGRTVALRQYHGTTPTPGTAGTWDQTSYTFNRKGQLEKVIDPAGNDWVYGYDIRGRQTTVDDPDQGPTTNGYDNGGRLTSTLDAAGNKLVYVYDALNRKRAVYQNQASGNPRAKWDYDTIAKGQLTRSTRMVGSTGYVVSVTDYTDTYQPKGIQYSIPSSETGLGGTYDFTYEYNPDGSLASTSLPSTNSDLPLETLSYDYDALGNPTTLHTAYGTTNMSYVPQTVYNALGQLEQITLDTDDTKEPRAWQAYTHELETGRLTGIHTERDTVTPNTITDLQYSYDDAGNITKAVDTAPTGVDDTQCFNYDHLRRLTGAWTPSSGDCAPTPTASGLGGPAPYWHSWTFDTIGNRLTQTIHTASGDTTTNYTPSTAQPHSLTRTTTGSLTQNYAYDPTGNTTCRPAGTATNNCTTGAGAQKLTWDPEGRIDTSTDSTGTTTYIYDADGNRLIRRDPTGRTLYLPGQEIRYNAGTGTTTCTRYYTHAGQTIASRNAAGLAWLANDGQGTAQTTINPITQAATTRRQTPYGTPRGINPTWPNDKGFVGGTNDNTRLTHLGAREYDPAIGRFISVDPVQDLADPQQWNGYTYANNNPTTLSDPTGLIPADCMEQDCYGYNPTALKKNGGGCHGGCGSIDNILWGQARGLSSTKSRNHSDPTVLGHVIKVPSNVPQEEFIRRWNEQRGKYFSEIRLPDDAEVIETERALAMNICHEMGRPGGCQEWIEQLYDAFIDYKAATLPPSESRLPIGVMPGFGGAPNSAPIQRGCRSFSADTRVLMADGSAKQISQIKVGDEVLAADPDTGEQGPRKVTAAWVHGDKLTDLLVEGAAVTTTEDHPFYNTTDRQWQRADTLSPGDTLLTSKGQIAAVVGIRLGPSVAAPAYNLTIAGIHTYYVLAGTTPVLVHNDDGEQISGTIARGPQGMTIQIYANDHGPAHAHLKGNGFDIQIGQNGKPLDPDTQLNSRQQQFVDDNIKTIRGRIGAKMREYRLNRGGC